ncbi:MAG TPA: hypothetical protein VGI17_02515 [Solirubrobacterales bacterium]
MGQIDGSPTRLPVTWSRSESSTYCLGCSRALAGEAALDSAPDASSAEDRAKLRRDAMIEFEIGRVPLAPNRTIAQACRTSLKRVASVRGGLEAASANHLPGAPGGV